jgi:hypothetical protein
MAEMAEMLFVRRGMDTSKRETEERCVRERERDGHV